MSNNHILINLPEELNQIQNYKTNNRTIIKKCIIYFKTQKENDEIIKQNKIYTFSDEYKMNNEIEERPKDYTYDIILIEAIIKKKLYKLFSLYKY